MTIESTFLSLDADESGYLDASELCCVLMENYFIEEFQARSLVEDFDLNHDGKIDKNEFIQLWTKLF